MSASDLLNYLALQDPSSGFSASVTGDANGTVLERLQYLVDNLPSAAAMPPAVTPLHRESLGDVLAAVASAAPASATWPSANQAVYIPFGVTRTVTAYRAFVYNGTAVSGNFDIGIYDSAGARVVNSGSTAQSGTSANQEVDIADTQLTPGLYYMALVFDNTTATTFRVTPGTQLLRQAGVMLQATAFTLPATLTFAAPTSGAHVPIFGFSLRATG